MLGILLIFILATYLYFFYPLVRPKEEEAPDKDSRYAKQMKKLWSVAQESMRQRKPLRAEKALLTILKFDEKNAAAYNRLGILYAKEQKYDEAIECFEIAQSLDSNASSLHNVGLIYLETGSYEKAAMAFKQAIDIEGDVPARFIALAKANEKLGKRKDALENLENAYSLSPTTSTLRQILALHEAAGDAEAVTETTARIEKHLAEEAATRKKSATSRSRARVARATTRRATRLARKSARSASATTVRTPAHSSRTPRASAHIATSSRPTTKSAAISRPTVRSTTSRPATKRRRIIQ